MTQDLQYLLVILTGVKPASIPWVRLSTPLTGADHRWGWSYPNSEILAIYPEQQNSNINPLTSISLDALNYLKEAGFMGWVYLDMQRIIVKSEQFSGGLFTVSDLHDDDRAIILPALPKCEERLIWKCSLNSHHITASNGWPWKLKLIIDSRKL